jgi:hypothetical protein
MKEIFTLACAGSSEVKLFSAIREVKCLVIDVVAAFPAYGCKLGVPFGHWAPTTCACCAMVAMLIDPDEVQSKCPGLLFIERRVHIA